MCNIHVRIGHQHVRLCTRLKLRCAQTDTLVGGKDISCPTLHTPLSCVCFSGQVKVDSSALKSVFAHARAFRVHKRTRARQTRARRVRFSTRQERPCAQTDTCAANKGGICPYLHTQFMTCVNTDTQSPVQAIARPYMHTGCSSVCKVGHKIGRMVPLLSVRTHHRIPCVHKRTITMNEGRERLRMSDGAND